MLRSFAYYSIGGRPLVLYIGLFTMLLFLTTAFIGRFRPVIFGKRLGTPVHKTFAVVALTVALIHGLLVLTAYL
jgi:hypothetical protein